MDARVAGVVAGYFVTLVFPEPFVGVPDRQPHHGLVDAHLVDDIRHGRTLLPIRDESSVGLVGVEAEDERVERDREHRLGRAEVSSTHRAEPVESEPQLVADHCAIRTLQNGSAVVNDRLVAVAEYLPTRRAILRPEQAQCGATTRYQVKRNALLLEKLMHLVGLDLICIAPQIRREERAIEPVQQVRGEKRLEGVAQPGEHRGLMACDLLKHRLGCRTDSDALER